MSLWLYTSLNPDGADSYGALNLYSDSIDPFGLNEYAIAQALPAQISVALVAHREIRGRGVAMTSRTIIGQALGILMERLGIDADQAFAYLRRVSNDSNRKLSIVALELVRARGTAIAPQGVGSVAHRVTGSETGSRKTPSLSYYPAQEHIEAS